MSGPVTGRFGLGYRPLTSRINPWEDSSAGAGTPTIFDPPDTGGVRDTLHPAPLQVGEGTRVREEAAGLAEVEVQRVIDQITEEQPVTEEAKQLVLELDAIRQRTRSFVSASRHRVRLALKAELVQVRAEGRAALDAVTVAKKENAAAQSAYSAHVDRYNQVRKALEQVRSEAPDPEQWPTDEEIAGHRARLARAEAALERAEDRRSELIHDMEVAQGRVAIAQRTLDEVRSRRDAVAARLAGRRPRGPYGLLGPSEEMEGLSGKML